MQKERQITYSRYTVEEQNRNNVKTNGDLKHPIALLSADELVMAGAFKEIKNQFYYLYDAYKNGLLYDRWWVMTPNRFIGTFAFEFYSNVSDNSLWTQGHLDSDLNASRPVINLKKELVVESGDGTKEGPYIVKFAN